MNNKYLFVIDETGSRKATFLKGVHGKTMEALRAKAEADYPDCLLKEGTDEDFNEFAANKIYVNGEFVEAPPREIPLEEVQNAKIAAFKTARDQEEIAPVTYNGHLFDFDEKSYDRITAAIDVLDHAGGTIYWTTFDNESVEMSGEDLHGVIQAAAVRSNQLHIKYRTLKNQVLSAETKEAVEAIVW